MIQKFEMTKTVKDIWKRILRGPREFCLLTLLVVQMCLIAISNIMLIDKNLDCDSAMLMRHIIAMWTEGTLAIPGWNYLTTLEWDCTTLLALPLYGVTGNIYVACALSNSALMCLFISAIFFMFDKKERLYPLLCANLICIPYRIGQLEYFNMLFFSGAQYIIKVMVPLLLIGILINIEQERNDRNKGIKVFFTVLYIFLLLVSSLSSNVYVAVCGVTPVWIVYICYKFLRWERIKGKACLLFGASIICTLLGILGNRVFQGESMASGMIFCDVKSMAQNSQSCFYGMFELLGGASSVRGITVLSFWGIVMLEKFCLVVVILVCGVIALVKSLRKNGNLRLTLLLGIFTWNYFILNVTDVRYGSYTYEYRYHLIGFLPLICVTVIVLLQLLAKMLPQQQRIMFASGVIVLLTLVGASYRELYMRGEQNTAIKEFVQYCENLEVETIYMFEDSEGAEISRLIDDTHLYLQLAGSGEVKAYNFYGIFNGVPFEKENAIVAVDEEINQFGDSFTLGENTFVKFDEAVGKSFYCLAEE